MKIIITFILLLLSVPTLADDSITKSSSSDNLVSEYAEKIRSIIHANWDTSTAPPDTTCAITFRQVPGGYPISVEFHECPYSPEAKSFVERAIMSSEFPYHGYESVFRSRINVTLLSPKKNELNRK